MPYLAGLKNALWTPIPPRTIKAGHPPAGFFQSATVPAPISATSPTFMAMMTVRLLNRSDSTPATRENSMSGRLKTTKAMVACVWEAASNAGPVGPTAAVTCLMASKATISFQALSLNAPKNCAINRPRRGCCVESGPVLMGVVTLRLR